MGVERAQSKPLCVRTEKNVTLVPESGDFSLSQTHSEQTEHCSRCTQPLKEHSPHRVDSSRGHFKTGVERVVSPQAEPVCHALQSLVSAVRLPATGPGGVGSGCNVSFVEESYGVRLSPSSHFGGDHQEGMRGVGDSDLGSSQLAISAMVPRPGPADVRSSPPSSATAGSARPAEDQGATQQSRLAQASRLVTMRDSLLSSGAQNRVIQLLLQSRCE